MKKILFTILAIYLSSSFVLAQELDSQLSNKVSDVIIDWQANTYTPFWYQGRKLPIAGSEIKISITPLDLKKSLKYIYRWSINDKLFKDWSAEKEIVFKMENIDISINISIGEREDIKTFIGDKVGERVTILKRLPYDLLLVEPELILYSENNNFLTYPKRLETSTGKTIKFSAVPFFFNLNNINQLNFNWSVFNKKISGEDLNPDKLSLFLNQSLKGQSSYISAYANQLGELVPFQTSNNILIHAK